MAFDGYLFFAWKQHNFSKIICKENVSAVLKNRDDSETHTEEQRLLKT